ncbi:unnamed protein product [Urochloa humidicola]
METVSAVAGWTAEDDVLLKKAVEAGASLEALSKGAVCFSHKFTLQELQDRWYSLLYDSETSAQASARMAKYEMELSVSDPAKAMELFNLKAKCFSLCKRKIDSVKNQYYARRKRVCPEPCLSANFGYVITPCSSTDGGGYACGGHHLVHTVDPSVAVLSDYGSMGGSYSERKHNDNGQYSFRTEHSDGSMVMDESQHGYSDAEQTSGDNIISADNRSDLSNQFENGAKGSKALPGIDQDQDGKKHGQFSGHSIGGLLEPGSIKAISQKWSSQEPSIPAWSMVMGVNSPDMLTDMGVGEPNTLMLSDDKKMKANVSDALASEANLDSVTPDSGLDSAMSSEGGFMHSHLKSFSQIEDLELLSDELFSDSALDTNQEDLGPRTCHASATNCGNHIDPVQRKQNVADVSGADTIPASSEVLHPEHNAKCVLNTEDSEIPFNDHISIPHQSSLEHEYCDNLHNVTLNKSIQGPDQMYGKFLSDKPKIGCETATKSCELSDAFPDTEFDNPIGTASTLSHAEGSESESSVPDYFDLEALILDQDLIPWDQESDFIQPEVSRFQYPESRKDLIRLEKGACSYMNRSIMSKGAFAILYGQRLKCYIRDPEVTLGRETGEIHVDIDLGKEGKANKISRRQAVIKMDDSGSFYIKNIGKCSIFVNSKEVPCNKRISLISDSLLEIRNMKFIFHVNFDAVKQYIARTRSGSSQGEITAYDWNENL